MGSDKSKRQELARRRVAAYKRDAPIFSAMAASVIGRATVQLLREKKPNVPAPVGTGVLFKASNVLFLLTAAHVSDEFKGRSTLLAVGNSILPVHGWIHENPLPPGSGRESDTLDFAIMRLDGHEADFLKPLAATPADIYDPPEGLVHGKGLVFSGFPSRNFRFIHERVIESRPMIAETHGAPHDWYQRLGLPERDHIIMKLVQHGSF